MPVPALWPMSGCLGFNLMRGLSGGRSPGTTRWQNVMAVPFGSVIAPVLLRSRKSRVTRSPSARRDPGRLGSKLESISNYYLMMNSNEGWTSMCTVSESGALLVQRFQEQRMPPAVPALRSSPPGGQNQDE